MDALIAINARHSTREYAARPVPREALEQIVDAGRKAPTARNEQPWEFVVVTDADMRQRIASITEYGKFIAQAPACVVVLCRDTKYYVEDGAAATTTLLMAAAALGVQSCWVAGDKKDYAPQIAALLNAPAGYRLVALVALGYAAGPEQPKRKRDLSSVLHWEKF